MAVSPSVATLLCTRYFSVVLFPVFYVPFCLFFFCRLSCATQSAWLVMATAYNIQCACIYRFCMCRIKHVANVNKLLFVPYNTQFVRKYSFARLVSLSLHLDLVLKLLIFCCGCCLLVA